MIPANNHPEIDRLIHLKNHLGGMTMSKPILLRRQFVPDGFRRGLLIVARVDAQFGEELHLRARGMWQ